MGDPEIDAMSSVATALSELDDDARSRVLRWAAERYGVTIKISSKVSGKVEADVVVVDDDDDVTDDEIAAEAPGFEHFAELFAAAQPTTNEDKALVAAYWIQVIQGNDKWQATSLTKDLKNLGHAIPNITDALSSNIKKKPQRVIQLAKSGSSAQARKTYKVTHEGIVYVQGMLSSGSGS